ncbi:MAG: hypothetical protein NC816_03585 [Candidatus Omnitrophica bacterium]|nr:hypothetical protein [Candidatus Omnitrophota bacterium]
MGKNIYRAVYPKLNLAIIPKIEIYPNSGSDMNKLCAIRKPAFHEKETVNYDDVVAFV